MPLLISPYEQKKWQDWDFLWPPFSLSSDLSYKYQILDPNFSPSLYTASKANAYSCSILNPSDLSIAVVCGDLEVFSEICISLSLSWGSC